MFVVTLKSKISKKLLRRIVVCLLVAVCMLVTFLCMVVALDYPSPNATCESVGEYSTAFDESDPDNFMRQFDIETDGLFSVTQVHIPAQFTETYTKYNELQKSQGLDLEKHKGKECTLYIYKLKDLKIDYADAYASIIVYKDKVIAGHISTGILGSAMYTFCGE